MEDIDFLKEQKSEETLNSIESIMAEKLILDHQKLLKEKVKFSRYEALITVKNINISNDAVLFLDTKENSKKYVLFDNDDFDEQIEFLQKSKGKKIGIEYYNLFSDIRVIYNIEMFVRKAIQNFP